ncbi:MAG: lipoprotein, partial [Candidatus Marinimicrobia bacterium]|nr:lipoprotein [Candidatus Neomarinimicrobiota bacterium]
MKRILFFIFAVLLLFSCQRDLSEFDYLVQPQIIYKQAQKML